MLFENSEGYLWIGFLFFKGTTIKKLHVTNLAIGCSRHIRIRIGHVYSYKIYCLAIIGPLASILQWDLTHNLKTILDDPASRGWIIQST